MPPIDQRRTHRAQAAAEWREACGLARDALQVKTNWTMAKIGAQAAHAAGIGVPFDRTAISRLKATSPAGEWRGPTAELCAAIDALCQQQEVGPYRLLELREAWERSADEHRYARENQRSRIQIGVPPLPAVALQHRTDLLDQGGAATTRGLAVSTQVAVGDGGMGKTQLARAAWDKADAAGCHVLLWVTASQRSSIVSAFAQAALQAQIDGVQPDTDPEIAEARFRSWLGSTPLSWLVVLDGVSNPADVAGLWPPDSATGRVVVTTRRRDLRRAGATINDVGVFSDVEAETYLRERLAQPGARTDSLDGASGVVQELQYLPLALAQAASYIIRKGITCNDYLDNFRSRSMTVDALFPTIDPADEYAYTVATAWLLAVDGADELEPHGLAGPALELACMLDPDGISEPGSTA